MLILTKRLSLSNSGGVKTGAFWLADLKPRVYWFAFQSKHSKNAFMYTPQRFAPYKSFERLRSESKFTQRQGSFRRNGARTKSV